MSTQSKKEATGSGENAEVNGINLYYESSRDGTAADPVARRSRLGRDVRADPHRIERKPPGNHSDLQVHGRTAEIDRPIDIRLMADDIAASLTTSGSRAPTLSATRSEAVLPSSPR